MEVVSITDPVSHWGLKNILTFAGGIIQQDTSSPGDFWKDNFLTEVIEEPTKKGLLLDLLHIL